MNRGTRYEVRGTRLLCCGVFCLQGILVPRTSYLENPNLFFAYYLTYLHYLHLLHLACAGRGWLCGRKRISIHFSVAGRRRRIRRPPRKKSHVRFFSGRPSRDDGEGGHHSDTGTSCVPVGNKRPKGPSGGKGYRPHPQPLPLKGGETMRLVSAEPP